MYSFNKHYFDIIDDEHKAYWLGFIWSDGYLGYRIRDNGREEYNLKLSLTDRDYEHLEKFNYDLNGNYNVHYYNHGKSSFQAQSGREARLFITNKHFGEILRNTYGIVPHREDCSKLLKYIPKDLVSHFIRGVVDADGSFCHYNIVERGYVVNKYDIKICGTIPMLQFIEKSFVDANLISDTSRKLTQRHKEEGRDSRCRTLELSGKNNVISVLQYLYKDATVYLSRKYEKYLNILEVAG